MKKRQGKSVRIVTEVGSSTGQKVGLTFFRGKVPMDGLWETPDVVITRMCLMPVGYGVGDHRMFVIDFLTLSLKGCNPPKIGQGCSQEAQHYDSWCGGSIYPRWTH